jgi:hypothetical protein
MEHLFFRVHDADGEEVRLVTHAFAALYAVTYWLTQVTMDDDTKQTWHDDNTLLLRRENFTLTIKGTDLQEAMEYEMTKEEREWTPPRNELSTIRQLRRFWRRDVPKEIPVPDEQPKEKPKQPKRHRSVKPSADGSITVAMICDEMGLAPNKGRNILRKANIEKPGSGWTFEANDPMLKKVRAALEAGNK